MPKISKNVESAGFWQFLSRMDKFLYMKRCLASKYLDRSFDNLQSLRLGHWDGPQVLHHEAVQLGVLEEKGMKRGRGRRGGGGKQLNHLKAH